MVKSTTILWRSHYNNGTNIGNTKDIVSTIVLNNGRDIVQGPYNNAAFLKVVSGWQPESYKQPGSYKQQ